MSLTDLWRSGQHGWPRRFPVAQFPNAPLLVSFAGSAVAGLSHGDAHDAGRAVSILGLAAWAWGELYGGVNWFRRSLGVVAFTWLVVRLAGDL